MDRQAKVGIAGAALLLVALILVLTVESQGVDDPVLSYPVTWPVSEAGATTQEGRLTEGESTTIGIDLPTFNVTTVEVVLTWSDDVGEPDAFNLTVVGPTGELTATAASDTGEARVRFDVAEPPSVSEVRGLSPANAGARLAAEETTAAAIGTWQVTIELSSAPGQRPVPGLPDLEVQPDGANPFQLLFRYNAYRAELGEPLPPA